MGYGRGTPQKKVVRMVRRVHEEVTTGPLYERTVKAMIHYRRLASLMERSSHAKRGSIDRRLEALGEEIAERLSEMSELERVALDCWKDGVERGFYEVDVEALMERPYRSIRRVQHYEYEYDVTEQKALEREAEKMSKETIITQDSERLNKFLCVPFEDDY